MSKVLIIGAGAVGGVTTHKCAQFQSIFSEIILASRTVSKCEKISKEVLDKYGVEIEIDSVDADVASNVVALIKKHNPDLIINVALPYQNLAIMDACLETRTSYLDTACYEAYDAKGFSYQQQWEYHQKFKDAGIMALLGCGFDPGVTNVFVKYAKDFHFDEIELLDILDCNAGDHGLPFATNFNPEINLRELDQPGKFYKDGSWKEIPALSMKKTFDFPEAGEKEMYVVYHEELETITKHIPEIKQARFWMTFGQSYINHLNAFKNVGLTSIKPVSYQGVEIVPIQFLKALLPDPATLGPRTKGKTNIGCIIQGKKGGKPKTLYVYQVCDHEECYADTLSQGVAYTAGVPPVIGAALMLDGRWRKDGVFNTEQLNSEPFLEEMAKFGLPWQQIEGIEFEA